MRSDEALSEGAKRFVTKDANSERGSKAGCGDIDGDITARVDVVNNGAHKRKDTRLRQQRVPEASSEVKRCIKAIICAYMRSVWYYSVLEGRIMSYKYRKTYYESNY